MKKIWEFIKLWMWQKPTAKDKESARLKEVIELTKEYMVITYCGQRINMLKIEYPVWKNISRKDKRATKEKFAAMERKKMIRWEEIDGKWICLKNKSYGVQ